MAICDGDERRDRPQPPFSLWVTGGVSPSASFWLLGDGRTIWSDDLLDEHEPILEEVLETISVSYAKHKKQGDLVKKVQGMQESYE